MRTYIAPMSLMLLAAFTACDKNTLDPIDSRTNTPFLSLAIVTPDSFYLDSMTPTGTNYHITAVIMVKVDPKKATSQSVTTAILRPSSAEEIAHTILNDNGTDPDQQTGDSIYSGNIDFDITRAMAGRYRVRCFSTNSDGRESNQILLPLKIARRNSSPVLLDASATPDTVDLPSSGYVIVKFAASASDSDGLADISEVFFTRLQPIDTNQTRFLMKDDGGLDPPVVVGNIAVKSGDQVAGDGSFSFLIPIVPENTRRTSLFGFQAIDSFGDTSNTITKYFTIR